MASGRWFHHTWHFDGLHRWRSGMQATRATSTGLHAEGEVACRRLSSRATGSGKVQAVASRGLVQRKRRFTCRRHPERSGIGISVKGRIPAPRPMFRRRNDGVATASGVGGPGGAACVDRRCGGCAAVGMESVVAGGAGVVRGEAGRSAGGARGGRGRECLGDAARRVRTHVDPRQSSGLGAERRLAGRLSRRAGCA
jgi:hypothetical protein